MSVIQNKILYFRSDFLDELPSQKSLNSEGLTVQKLDRENPLLLWNNIETQSDTDQNDEFIGFGWWVEVFTIQPICLYYFGPFDQRLDAALAQGGYIKDLQAEDAEIIAVQTKRCQPRQLTLSQLDLKPSDFRFLSSLMSAGYR